MLRHRSIFLLVATIAWSAAQSQEIDVDGTVAVSGGTFLMGTNATDIPSLKLRYKVGFPGVFENEMPLHKITVSAFRIDQYEVTYARFAEFLNSVPEWHKDDLDDREHNGMYLTDWEDGQYPDGKAQQPIVFITWAAAQSFCRWSDGRLPTEAEWEFVARNGDDREFPWGDELPSPERANYYASDNNQAINVGAYAPNDLGIYDLSGNVWEFLIDVWTANYLREEQSDPLVGGKVPDEEIRHITGRRAVRGASFGGSIVNLRTRWRDSHVVTNATEFVGFRCTYPDK